MEEATVLYWLLGIASSTAALAIVALELQARQHKGIRKVIKGAGA